MRPLVEFWWVRELFDRRGNGYLKRFYPDVFRRVSWWNSVPFPVRE